MRWITGSLLAVLGGCAVDGSLADEQALTTGVALDTITQADPALIGQEIGLPRHMEDGDELNVSIRALVRHGKQLFEAVWTPQEGGRATSPAYLG